MAAACLGSLIGLAQPAQKMDDAYGAKIKEYTTEPYFLTEMVDHLPASDTVPSPEKVLGYVIGTPNRLTYVKDIMHYMSELAKASPRVRYSVAGKSEEGRDTGLVLISDEANLAKLAHFTDITAKLADPRKLTDDDAKKLIAEGIPIYWLNGSIHSPETGSPEMLMELAYRLAVEDSPRIRNIRKNSIIMITPVIEVDGRDMMVDLYRWKKEHPSKAAPPLVYWGKYVAHDNNRDSMVMSLALSRIVMKTFFEYHPQVLHDLHESVPFMYISTGMGPYNPSLDPIVISEWQKMAYNEIEEMTKRGVPGVWTHGFYDGWAVNYMFMAAQGHNSIGRFYETFGNGGADTRMRTVPAGSTSREWFRPNPPMPRVNWSIRNNINMQQSGVLLAMDYVASNKEEFLNNFYLKSKRSVLKATTEGPAAYVVPGNDPRPIEAAELMNVLKQQGVEISRADKEFEVTMGKGKHKFPAGSYVIRMDQPYSRMADMLLDTQYYNVNDPAPYDDTGWTFGPLRNVETERVVDTAVLKVPMTTIEGPVKVKGGIQGTGAAYVIDNNAEVALATLRYALRDVPMLAAEEKFDAGGKSYSAGSYIIKSEDRSKLEPVVAELGLHAYGVAEMPKVATHALAVPRIAMVHSWLNTQNEGWYRIAFDAAKIPYTYISDHVLRDTPNLRERFDVIILGPTPGSAQRVVNGMTGKDPIPWKKSAITPNMGDAPDSTDDMRGGMELQGLVNVQKFVDEGGLFVTVGPNASIPIEYGLVDGISVGAARELKARGSVLLSSISDKGSPITYGYGDKLAVYFNQTPVFNVSANGGFGGGGFGGFGGAPTGRASGRGTLTDPDVVQGRPYQAPPPKPEVRPGEEAPLDPDIAEQLRPFLPSPEMRPRVVVRFAADEKELLVSGMLAGGRELTGKPAVVDAPRGKGHILMFAINPMWRSETQGSYSLLYNAMLNYDHLGVGRRAAGPREGRRAGASPTNDQ
jgi:hypothetical protein